MSARARHAQGLLGRTIHHVSYNPSIDTGSVTYACCVRNQDSAVGWYRRILRNKRRGPCFRWLRVRECCVCCQKPYQHGRTSPICPCHFAPVKVRPKRKRNKRTINSQEQISRQYKTEQNADTEPTKTARQGGSNVSTSPRDQANEK